MLLLNTLKDKIVSIFHVANEVMRSKATETMLLAFENIIHTSVHPMRESAVSEFVKMADADWSLVHQLITQSKLVETEYEGQKFYLRNPLSYKGN